MSTSKKNQIDWSILEARAREVLSAQQFKYFQHAESVPSKYRAELETGFQKLKDAARAEDADK